MGFSLQGWVYDHTDAAITYSGNWTAVEAILPFGDGSDSGILDAALISVKRTEQLGDWAELKFNGSSVQIHGTQGWDHGFSTITLDGKEVVLDTCTYAYAQGVPTQNRTDADFPSFISSMYQQYGLSTHHEHTIRITNSQAGLNGSALEFNSFTVNPYSPLTIYKFTTALLFIGALLLATAFAIIRRILSTSTEKGDHPSEKNGHRRRSRNAREEENFLYRALVSGGLIADSEPERGRTMQRRSSRKPSRKEVKEDQELVERLREAGFL